VLNLWRSVRCWGSLRFLPRRTGLVYQRQQNGYDASLAYLVLSDRPLDYEVVVRISDWFISH